MNGARDPGAAAPPVAPGAAPGPAPSGLRHRRTIGLLVVVALLIVLDLALPTIEVAIARHWLPIDFDHGRVQSLDTRFGADQPLVVIASSDVARDLLRRKYGWWIPPFLLKDGLSASGQLYLGEDGDPASAPSLPWTARLTPAADPVGVTGRLSAHDLAALIAPYTDLDLGILSLSISVDQAQLWLGTGISGHYRATLIASGTCQVGYGANRTTVVIRRLDVRTPVTFHQVAGGWAPELAIDIDTLDLADPRYAMLNLPASRAQLSQLVMAKLAPRLAGLVIPDWCPRNAEVHLEITPAGGGPTAAANRGISAPAATPR